jgi:AcrR family transcriptional regulator
MGYTDRVTDATALSRRERRVADTRAALVAAAKELFHQKGFTETTVDEIAERADVAQRTFFRYFPSKEAVLFAEFEELHERLLSAFAARPPSEPPFASLYLALHEHVKEVESRFQSLAWVVETAEQCRGFGVEGAVMRLRVIEDLTAALAARLDVDPAVDPRPAAWAGLMLSCFGAAMRTVVRGETTLGEAFDRLIVDTANQLTTLPPVAGPARPRPPRRPPG